MSTRVSDFKKACQDVSCAVKNEVKSVSHSLSRTVKKLDGYDRLFKFATGLGDFMVFFTGPNAVYSAMRTQFKGVNEIVSPLHIVTRIREWSVKESRDKILKDWKETAKIGLLTVANTLDTVKFLDTVNLIRLGQIASTTVRLPFFSAITQSAITLSPITLVSNACVILSSSFSLMQQPKKLAEGARDLKKVERDELREQKWDIKLRAFEELKQPAPNAGRLDRLKSEYKDVRLNLELKKPLHQRLGYVTGTNWVAGADANFDLKWAAFVNRAAPLQNDSPEVARWTDKVECYSAAKEVHKNLYKKGWWTVANDIAKIAIISFSVIGMTLLGAASFPVVLAFLATGLCAGTIGYRKFLIDDWIDEHKAKMEDKIAASVQTRTNETFAEAKKRKLASIL